MRTFRHVADRELLRRARAGNAEAFGQFYDAHRGAVLAFFRVRVASSELAADLMAETFARALAAVHETGNELPVIPFAWLVTIARNLLVDSLRRGRVDDQTRQRLAIEPLELTDRDLRAIEQESADADLVAQLRRVLPVDEFEAFVARVLDDRDYAGIAHELDVSESVVRKRVSRARARLQHLGTGGTR